MSVTFYPSYEWKMKEIPCTYCKVCDAGSEQNTDPFCTGVIKEPDCPTINMANGNAYAMLELLGLANEDCCGEVSVEDLPNVMRAIIKAQNVSARRESATATPYESGGPGTGQCRVIYCGRSAEYVTMRLGELMDLVNHCRENSCGFYWC